MQSSQETGEAIQTYTVKTGIEQWRKPVFPFSPDNELFIVFPQSHYSVLFLLYFSFAQAALTTPLGSFFLDLLQKIINGLENFLRV